MSVHLLHAGATALALLVYLLVALVRPERF